MSIEDSQNLFFCNISSHSFSERSGPGSLGTVRKILVVRSGPEGPLFARSGGTLDWSLFQISSFKIDFQHFAKKMGKQSWFSKYVPISYYKVVCSTLFKLVQTCPNLLKLACPSMLKLYSYLFYYFFILYKQVNTQKSTNNQMSSFG